MSNPDDNPIRRAIVGDDGLADGGSVLEAAGWLHATLGTSLHVVHAIDVPDPINTGRHPEQLLSIRAEMAERAAAWLEARVHATLPDGSEPSLAVEFGRPRNALVRAARTLSADLIMIGQHRRESPFEMGSTQRSVFGNDTADVWSQPRRFASVERVIAPVDPQQDRSDGVERACAIARALGVTLVTLHCSDNVSFVQPEHPYVGEASMPTYVVDAMHERSRSDFETWFESRSWDGVDAEARFVVGRPVHAILSEQGERDLVVMGTRGNTGLSSLLVGGVAIGVLGRARGPVLTVGIH